MIFENAAEAVEEAIFLASERRQLYYIVDAGDGELSVVPEHRIDGRRVLETIHPTGCISRRNTNSHEGRQE